MTWSGPQPRRKIPFLGPKRARLATKRLGYGSALLRRLGVPLESSLPDAAPGLIVIQIDGLSAARLKRYLNRRYMPFLRGMVQQRQLVLRGYSSEVPTSTPAFQAGCFYGTNEGIPGFQFYDKRTRQRYRMGSSANALEIQEGLPKPGVLQGGTVYSCVYDGDAAGSLFIFSSLLNPARWRLALRLWDLAILAILHIGIILRIVVLALFEFVLALAEFPLWLRQTGRLYYELQIILIRVGLLIIGREMITLNSIIDLQRGVPIIYTNFLGYDECGHLRGPDSPSARLQLRAIDRCVRRIHRALLRSDRNYRMILLSDHGQAACIPFEQVTGLPVGPWLEELLMTCPGPDASPSSPSESATVDAESVNDRVSAMASDQADALRRIQPGYPSVLRKSVDRIATALENRVQTPGPLPVDERAELVVSISGPTAHIYWAAISDPLKEADIQSLHPGILEALIQCEAIGCVSLRGPQPGEVLILGHQGRAVLHEDGTRTITGTLPPDKCSDPDHAYAGIHRVSLMPRSGDIVLWGNGAPVGEVSFLNEKGCHSGFSDQETQAFVLEAPDCEVDFGGFRRHAQFHGALQSLRPPMNGPTADKP